jgi:hypothetical protein
VSCFWCQSEGFSTKANACIEVEGDEAEIARTPLSLASMSKQVTHVRLKIAKELASFSQGS